MSTSPDIISAERFEAAFRLEPNPWPQSLPDRALVQLGLPSSTSLTLWLAPARGGRLDPSVTLTEHPRLVPRLVPAGSTGLLRVELTGLSPGTSYAFTVRPSGGAPSQLLRASTAPAPTDTGAFSFLASSCFAPYEEPRGRFGALVEGRIRIASPTACATPHLTRRTAHVLRLLEHRARLAGSSGPAFLLGLGDQVYADAGDSADQAMLRGVESNIKRYAPGDAAQFFETIYRATFSLEPYAAALQALPSAMIWDDHEIRDGWGSHGDEEESSQWRQHLETARDYFVGWQASRNPPRRAGGVATAEGYAEAARVGQKLTRNPEFDFSFDWGQLASFFVMDLRSFRNANERRVVSEEQLERLRNWLTSRDDAPTLWVLGSPLPLGHAQRFADRLQARYLRQRRDDMLDAWWSEQLASQRMRVFKLLDEHFRTHPRHRLLVLSGDVHFSELLELSHANGRVFGHEVVSSGLAQSFFKVLRGSSERCAQLPCGVLARGLGRFHGPAFAEIFVRRPASADQPPEVALTFHTSATRSGRYLANHLGPSAQRLKLPLVSMSHRYGQGDQLFAQFIERDPRRSDATAVEPTGRIKGTL